MSVDELRAGFDRLARDVVPIENPYGRLLLRRNRRLRHRIGAILGAAAAAIAAAVLAPLALNLAGPPQQDGFPIISAWTRQHLEAPTRGNMPDAAVAELAGFLAGEGRDRLHIADSLPHTKVLFAYEHDDMWQAVVAYHSDTDAVVFTRSAPLGEPPEALLRSSPPWRSEGDGVPLSPFTVVYSQLEMGEGAYVGLAPPSCQISTSVSVTYATDGSWQRDFTETQRSYAVNHNHGPAEVWHVTCDDETRAVRPARTFHRTTCSYSAPDETGRGTIDPGVAFAASCAHSALHFATGAGDTNYAIVWGGSVSLAPDEGPAILLAPANGAQGIVTFTFGISSQSLVALEPARSRVLPETTPDPVLEYSLTSTGLSDGSGVYVIRIPRREAHRAVLSEHVLLVGPESAVSAAAVVGPAGTINTAPLVQGVGTMELAFGAADEIQFFDAAGNQVAMSRFVEQHAGPRIFDEPIISNWS